MDRLRVLRAIDKLDRLGPKAVLELLTVGRRDPSGDFMPGAGLGLEAARFILSGIDVDVQVVCWRPETGAAIVQVDRCG